MRMTLDVYLTLFVFTSAFMSHMWAAVYKQNNQNVSIAVNSIGFSMKISFPLFSSEIPAYSV